MPAAWFRVIYPSRLLRWLVEDHVFLREALVRTFPRAVRRELAMNERVVEIPFAIRALRVPAGGRVLDVGSRWSPLPLFLASLGYRVVATDLAPFPLQGSGVDFLCADLLRPPFRPASFDGAVAVSTLEHVGVGFYVPRMDPDADVALMRSLRILVKREGLLVLTVPFGRGGVGALQRCYDGERLRRVTDGWIWDEARFSVRRRGTWEEATEVVASQEDSTSQTRAVALLALRRP